MAAAFLPPLAPKTLPSGMIMVYFQSRLALLKPAGIFFIRNIGPTAVLPSPVPVKLSFRQQCAQLERPRFFVGTVILRIVFTIGLHEAVVVCCRLISKFALETEPSEIFRAWVLRFAISRLHLVNQAIECACSFGNQKFNVRRAAVRIAAATWVAATPCRTWVAGTAPAIWRTRLRSCVHFHS